MDGELSPAWICRIARWKFFLSLDGGKTIYARLTESRNPAVQYFDWTVPNTPTNEAVLDIRFGCLNLYPETSSLQVQTAFAIGPTVN